LAFGQTSADSKIILLGFTPEPMFFDIQLIEFGLVKF